MGRDASVHHAGRVGERLVRRPSGDVALGIDLLRARLDENADGPRWSIPRTIVEASFVGITSLLLIDLWARVLGPIV
jgi:hypothetical protein